VYTKILFIVITFFGNTVNAQTRNNQVELSPYIIWSSYPSFKFQSNTTQVATVKMSGTSWGIDAAYKLSLPGAFFLKLGLGYHKYSFNHIHEQFGIFSHDNRKINYPGGSSRFSYITNKYWYHTISGTIGVEKLFSISAALDFTAGADFTPYYTFSQRYIIPGTYSDVNYNKSNSSLFGLSFLLKASLLKKMDRLSLGPSILLPLFSSWKQDVVFPTENNNRHRSKWAGGIGVGFKCNYSLTKK
jgi:hypothetical protein